MSFTKVKKLTGGVPSLPGSAGTTGQALIKLSNSPGDYDWANIPYPVQASIQSGSNQITTATSSGVILVTTPNPSTGNPAFMEITYDNVDSSPGVYLNGVAGINSSAIRDYKNPDDAPETYPDQVDLSNVDTNKAWTANKILTLVGGGITLPSGVPIGNIMIWPSWGDAPTGWLRCQGQILPISQYPDLSDTLEGIWDTAAVTSGYFQLPDLRGVFLRGADAGRGLDSDPGRVVGSYQNDKIREHQHAIRSNTNNGSPNVAPAFITNGTKSSTWNTENFGEEETVPKNVAIDFIIKAT